MHMPLCQRFSDKRLHNRPALTHADAWVIVAGMKKLVWWVWLIVSVISLACSTSANLPFNRSTEIPLSTVTPAPLTATPEPSPTPTFTPTPTPPPIVRISNADQARFEGDWERAFDQYSSVISSGSDESLQSAAILGMGISQISSGEYQAGVDSLLNLIASYPQSPEIPYAHFYLGQAYSALGMDTEAAQAYLEYLILRPGILEGYVLNLRGDALSAAGDYAGALIDYRAALQSPGFLNSENLEIKIARSHAAVGDYATALGIYQDIYNRTQDDYTKAQMDLLMGQAYTALGQYDQAYAVYQDAVNNFPASYDSYQALVALVEAGVPVDELNRGITDYFAGEYSVAITAFDRYFQAGPADESTARYYNGLALRALGGFNEAIQQWDIIIQNYPEDRFWDAAWDQKAYTQWYYQSEPEQAIQTLTEFVAIAPAHPRAGEFLFDAAEIAEQFADLEQAALFWERVANEYPTYEEAQRAIFLTGITRFRQGQFESASAIFQRALASAATLQDRAAASYWQGKSQAALGDPVAAQASWELTANIDPTGYYSERARDILRQRPPFSPPEAYDLAVDRPGERAQAEAWLRETFSIPAEEDLSSLGPLLGEGRMFRGTELWELGLYEYARLEFEDLRLSLQSDPANSYRLANYLADLGLYRSAILAARQVLDMAGMSDADTMAAPAHFNHIRFGTYFADLIIPVAQEYQFHPLQIFSLVRQESAFEGFVRSFAGARGLMQIIPATGQEISARLNWPGDYTNDELYRPKVSIRMGTEYLAQWRDYFGGDMYAALAAYNGGPGNSIEWEMLANDDQDLFLEIIRFEETRNYVRSIYEIFNIYRRIYDRTP